jgi:hypothetical protein
MIGFQKTDKKKADGKPFWLLVNPDMSGHVHIEPKIQAGLERIPNIEQPPARPVMTDKEELSLSQDEIAFLKKYIALLKVNK